MDRRVITAYPKHRQYDGRCPCLAGWLSVQSTSARPASGSSSSTVYGYSRSSSSTCLGDQTLHADRTAGKPWVAHPWRASGSPARSLPSALAFVPWLTSVLLLRMGV